MSIQLESCGASPRFQPGKMAAQNQMIAVFEEFFGASEVDCLGDMDALMQGMERLAGCAFHKSLNFVDVIMHGNRLLPHDHAPSFIPEFWGETIDEQLSNVHSYLRVMFFRGTSDGQGGTVSNTFPPKLRARFLAQAAKKAGVWEENQNGRNSQDGKE